MPSSPLCATRYADIMCSSKHAFCAWWWYTRFFYIDCTMVCSWSHKGTAVATITWQCESTVYWAQGHIQGSIRSWFAWDDIGVMLYNIKDNRWCGNVGRAHKSNGIFIIADLQAGIAFCCKAIWTQILSVQASDLVHPMPYDCLELEVLPQPFIHVITADVHI